MMKMTKILVSVIAVGVAFVGITATTESQAGDESLVSVSCTGGKLTAKGARGGKPEVDWHVNEAAPWKWDKGEKKSLTKDLATFEGAKCEGTLKAYVCSGDQCKGPIPIAVH